MNDNAFEFSLFAVSDLFGGIEGDHLGEAGNYSRLDVHQHLFVRLVW